MHRSLALGLALAAAFSVPAFAGGEEPKGGMKGGSPAAPAGPEKDWSKHKGDIPFIVGREAGMKEVEFTGKPVMFFYTATW